MDNPGWRVKRPLMRDVQLAIWLTAGQASGRHDLVHLFHDFAEVEGL